MKKNKFITNLFLSCLTLSASLFLGNQAFANSADTTAQERIITESSQKLTQLKEKKQKFSEQKNDKYAQLSNLEKKIQKIQIDLEQLEKIESTGSISETLEVEEYQTLTPNVNLSAISIKDGSTLDKKGKLTELKQKKVLLKTDTEAISKQQSELNKQEAQLSEKITLANQEKTDQAKQTDTRSAVVAAAKTHLGKPYVYGAAGPDTFDCSGLVQTAFASAGHALGRTTIDQETAGATISVSEAQAGDLVFWGSHGGTYHVGISTGDGSYIHAPVPGDVVQIATVASYAPDFAVQVL